jgi:hypothetical protein
MAVLRISTKAREAPRLYKIRGLNFVVPNDLDSQSIVLEPCVRYFMSDDRLEICIIDILRQQNNPIVFAMAKGSCWQRAPKGRFPYREKPAVRERKVGHVSWQLEDRANQGLSEYVVGTVVVQIVGDLVQSLGKLGSIGHSGTSQK